ncbi:MAG: GTPase domain-containing protein, partial [Planctomycetia bacterium]
MGTEMTVRDARPMSSTPAVRAAADAPSYGRAEAAVAAALEGLDAYYQQRGLGPDEISASEMRFAAALARRRLLPPDSNALVDRLHIMVVGGAGAGKSTVANILLGGVNADVNPQAGYTRHPIAFGDASCAAMDWPVALGALRRADDGAPASLDEDRYAVRAAVPLPSGEATPSMNGTGADDFLEKFVVWDCPDLTTKDAADHYLTRVMEVAGLCDVVVYVASDERYNDELPTRILKMLVDAGKPTVAVLTKMAPGDADEFVTLFNAQVATALPHRERL